MGASFLILNFCRFLHVLSLHGAWTSQWWLVFSGRNAGLPGPCAHPVVVPSCLIFKLLILGQVGAVSAGAPPIFPAETSLQVE